MVGLSLHYAHRLRSLVRDLAAQLKPRLEDATSLFCPVDIIVPNLTMQCYLEQEIARQLGVTPNLRFHLLRSYLADHLSLAGGDASSDRQDISPQILGAEQLQHILIDTLRDGRNDALCDCDPLWDYLRVEDANGQPNIAAQELRLYQITEELARLFIEYSFSRSASVFGTSMKPAPLLVKWGRGQVQNPENSIEKWQKALWLHIFGPTGVINTFNARSDTAGNMPLMTLADAFVAFESIPDTQKTSIPGSVYMVGFPYIARIFVEATQLLAEYADVHVYALTPAQQWASESNANRTEKEHPLLRQWGEAGAIHAKMWAATTAKTLRTPTVDEAPKNLLQALQNDTIAGKSAPVAAQNRTNSTDGIQFFECPSIAREVDAVSNEIWALLKDTKDLRPDDIAVLIAGSDQEAYQTQIGEAFRSFHLLPFNEVGLPETSGGRLLDAAKLLLALPFGRFRRSELLKLLVHPNLRGRGDEVDADQWGKWCDKLGILYAASRDEQSDSYLGDRCRSDKSAYRWDLYNWDQGFRRVVLGNFLSGERSGVDALFRMNGSDYQPLEIGDCASPATSNFVALASSIMADARWLCGPEDAPTQRNARQWAAIVEDYFRTYLQVSDQEVEDAPKHRERDRYYLRAACRAIRKAGQNCPVEGLISYRIFNEFARDAIENLRQSGSHYLSGGVVVSTLLETRAIPFEHIFVVGLGEGQFPNPQIQNALDLRLDNPQLGDLKPADRDRYAFLETLLAARRGITLSWVAREATTGETLNASSVVNELRWVLQNRFATSADELSVTQPLRRYDSALFAPKNGASNLTPSMHPRAFEERRVMALREALVGGEDGQKPRVLPTLDEIRRKGAGNMLSTELREALKLPALPSESSSDADTPKAVERAENSNDTPKKRRRIHISLSKLRKFLESPLQAAASVQLGLRDDEEDIFVNERESLEASRLYRAIALRTVTTHALAIGADSDALEDTYNKTLLPLRCLQGQLPSGHFLESNRDTHLQILKAWWRNFDILNIQAPLSPIGIGVNAEDCADNYDAIEFELTPDEHGVSEPVLVEITGRTELTSLATGSYVVFDAGTGTFPRHKYISRAFISWATATAAGRIHTNAPRFIVNNSHKLTGKTGPRFNIDAPDWSKDEARKYLKKLIVSLLTENHDYLLPIEYVAQKSDIQAKDCTPDALQKWLDKKISDDYGSFSSQYGAIKDYERFGAPRDRKISAILDERFPYLSWSDK